MSIHALSGSFLSALGVPERVPLRHFSDRNLAVVQCKSAAVAQIFDYVRGWSGEEVWDSGLYGAACEFDPQQTELKALGEAAERYTSTMLAPGETRIARADELGEAVFDWTRLPQLSPGELSDPKQSLHPFSERASMRWVEAIDMRNGSSVHVPLILTFLYPRAWSTERFTYPVSTGTAVHPDPRRAMVSATLEVIERDALSLNWLLRRPLKRIRLSAADASHFDRDTWSLLEQKHFRLYDATTDLGIPIVYARCCRPDHPRVANVFGCACDFDAARAIGKAARESIMIAHALESNAHRPPADPFDCHLIVDGACTMMAPARHADLMFLDEAGETTFQALSGTALPAPDAVDARIGWLAAHLAERDQPFYMAEITCDELTDVGLRAFRAILPGLMPLSFVHRARFLGSQRLADMHRHWGLPGSLEDRINPWPQPFS